MFPISYASGVVQRQTSDDFGLSLAKDFKLPRSFSSGSGLIFYADSDIYLPYSKNRI
jgi:hypothetical protein